MGAEKTMSLAEEIANSVTHGIGTGLSIAGLTLMVALAAIYGDAWRVVSASIYGSTLIVMYLSSTFYHSFQDPKVKHVFKIIDHSAIYLLIAGTYTPLLLVSMRGVWGWSLLAVIWSLAIAGVVFKTFHVNRFKRASLAVYLVMGWLCVVAINQMIATVPLAGLVWLGLGGVSYTAGVAFYVWHDLPFNHMIWHLFVLGGSVCHYFAILLYVLPMN